MDDRSDLATAKEQVFLNIGKNVILFQQMEHLAKAILAQSSARGELGESDAENAPAKPPQDDRSLGQVAGALFKEVVVPNDKEPPAISPSHTFELPSFSSSMAFQANPAQHAQQEVALRRVVKQRNELVHGFVPMWNWKSVESMAAATQVLIDQRAEAEQQFSNLKSIFEMQRSMLADLKDYIDSEAGARQFELAFSPLVLALCDAAHQYARDDGWTLLSTAGQYVRRHASEEMDNLKARYGFGSLSALIAGVNVFELKSEPSGSGTRQVFRVRCE